MSYGRNFLWKEELKNYFQADYLTRIIWDQKSFDSLHEYQSNEIRSCFCRLLLSLYIDHSPLHRVLVPNFCRLYGRIDQPEDYTKVFEQNNQTSKILQELIDKINEYVLNFYAAIDTQLRIIKFDKEKVSESKHIIGHNLLKNQLLLSIMEMIDLMLNLNIFNIVDKNINFGTITQSLFMILMYEKNAVKFVSACHRTEEQNFKERQQSRDSRQNALLGGLGNMMGGLSMLSNLAQSVVGQEQKEDDEEGESMSLMSGNIDDNSLFRNPIMRGFIKLNNILENMSYQDDAKLKSEIDIKLKICDIFERILDQRQDYLITNVLCFFREQIVKDKDILTKQKEKQNFMEYIIDNNLRGFLPNVEVTGIEQIDKEYFPKQEESSGLLGGFGMNMFNDEKEFQFKQYCDSSQIPEFPDLIGWMSVAMDREKDGPINFDLKSETFKKIIKDPVGAVLPQLLSTYMLVRNEELERRILSLMMRIFNQRWELKINIVKLQLIFDDEQTSLFMLLKQQINECAKYIQQSEIWFSTFQKKNDENQDHEVYKILKILGNFNNGLFQQSIVNDEGGFIEMNPNESEFFTDPDKQKIYAYLKAYEPVLTLIRDGMPHFNNYIMDEDYPLQKKKVLVKLYETAFNMLTLMVRGDLNGDNQMELFKYFDLFFQNIKYDLGQIDLMIEIFRDNYELLHHHVNQKLIDRFMSLIEYEGRQQRILDFFETLIVYKGKLIFENQILILNAMIPLKEISDKQLKLLYCDGCKPSMLRFYLEDNAVFENKSLVEKLIEVEFRDTYRDEAFLYHGYLTQMLLNCTLDAYRQEENYQENLEKIDDRFNISIAKLKKLFRASYLMDLIKEDDNFLDFGIANSTTTLIVGQKQKEELPTIQERVRQGASGPGSSVSTPIPISPNASIHLNSKVGPRGTSVLTTDVLGLIQEEQKAEQQEENRRQNENFQLNRRRGFSLLKPFIVQFFRSIHILSDKGHLNTEELLDIQQDFSQVVENEAKRLQVAMIDHYSEDYPTYIFDSILSLFETYRARFIDSVQHSQNQDDDRRDIAALTYFAGILFKKLNNFNHKVSQIQINRCEKFIRRFIKIKGNFPEISIKLGGDIIQPSNSSFKDIGPSSGNNQDPNQSQQDINLGGEKSPLLSQEKNLDKERLNSIKDSPSQSGLLTINSVMKAQSALKAGIQQRESNVGEIAKKEQKASFSFFKREVNDLTPLQIEELWMEFVGTLNSSKTMHEEIQRQRSALSDAIMKIDFLIGDDMQRQVEPKPELQYLLKKIITFLQYSVGEPKNKSTIIVLLQIMENIVKKAEDQKKVETQNIFDKLGATQMVLYVLSENTKNLDGELLIQFLIFANSLLDGGNQRIQKTIYDFCITNQSSELIFMRFNNIIQKQIEHIQQQAHDQAKYNKSSSQLDQNSNSNINSSSGIGMDVNDIVDPDAQEEEDFGAGNNDTDILENVLQFMQMCVEGHYLDLQNYLRQQTNSIQNYDMVNAVADLLRAYFFDARTCGMYDSMMQCFDTLSEFVQGPCPENQVAVSESKFFDLSNDLFYIPDTDKLDKKKKQEPGFQQRGTRKSMIASQINTKQMTTSFKNKGNQKPEDPLTPWMMARLQNQFMILTLSLLESRDVTTDNQILKRILRNLPLPVLEKNITRIYKRYQQQYQGMYTMDALKHLDKDPRQYNQTQRNKIITGKNTKRHFENILQNGIYMFILICYYLDSGDQFDGQIVQLIKRQRRVELKEEKTLLEELLMGDNLIGQLLSFVLTLIEAFNNAALEIKKQTLDRALINEDDPEYKKKMQREQAEKKQQLLRKCVDFYYSITAHIDVVRNDKLEMVYFMLLPYCQDLPKDKKTAFQEVVDRANVKSQVTGLTDISNEYIEIMKHQNQLKLFFNQYKFLAIFANYVKLWKDLAFVFTLVLNIFILTSYSSLFGDRMTEPRLLLEDNETRQSTEDAFRIIGIIMTCCACFVVAFFLMKNAPLIIQKAWEDQQKKGQQKQAGSNLISGFVVLLFKLLQVLFFLLQDVQVVYYLSFGTLAVFGTIWHPFFFCFHLSEVLLRFPTLKNVINAFWQPREQLFLTFILFLIMIYIFSIIEYLFFFEEFQGNCDSMFYCFFFTFDFTFKANGGVGGWLSDNTDVDDKGEQLMNFQIGRFILDNIFNIILPIIMVNIVSGVIIDTFGSLREAENQRKADIQEKCFICDNLKVTFDRQADQGAGFVSHIRMNHYMWNYLFYIAYLKEKPSSQFTGIETHINNLILDDDVQWFPFNKARELVNQQDSEKQNIDNLSNVEQDFDKAIVEADIAGQTVQVYLQTLIKIQKISDEQKVQVEDTNQQNQTEKQ